MHRGPDLADRTAATAWLDTELVNLMSSAAHAAEHGWTALPVQLSRNLFHHLDNSAHHEEARVLHGLALRAARCEGDLTGQFRALLGLGTAHLKQGRYQEARGLFQRHLTLARQAGDRVNETRALGSLGRVDQLTGRLESALGHHQRVLALVRQVGSPDATVRALINLANVNQQLGRFSDAFDHYQQALGAARHVLLRHAGAELPGDQPRSSPAPQPEAPSSDESRAGTPRDYPAASATAAR